MHETCCCSAEKTIRQLISSQRDLGWETIFTPGTLLFLLQAHLLPFEHKCCDPPLHLLCFLLFLFQVGLTLFFTTFSSFLKQPSLTILFLLTPSPGIFPYLIFLQRIFHQHTIYFNLFIWYIFVSLSLKCKYYNDREFCLFSLLLLSAYSTPALCCISFCYMQPAWKLQSLNLHESFHNPGILKELM